MYIKSKYFKAITIPYFYIIRDTRNDISYAGARWANGCSPDEFMKDDGYKTSSNIINKIINEFGLDIFVIDSIITDCGELTVLEYETQFLIDNDCANSPNWYNRHNNNNWGKLEKRPDTVREMLFATNIAKYGVKYPMQSDIVKQKCIDTWMINYGVPNPVLNPVIAQKIKDAIMVKYGSESYLSSEEYKNILNVCEYCGETFIGDVGNFYKHHNENCKRNPNRIITIHHCVHCNLSTESYTAYLNYHGDKCKHNPNRIMPTIYHCVHCGIETISASGYSQHHGDKCKHNPNRVSMGVNIDDMILCEYCEKYHIRNTHTIYHGKNCKKHPDYVKPPKVTCEYCSKIIEPLTYKQSHGINCKQNPNNNAKHIIRLARTKVICEYCNIEICRDGISKHHKRCKENPHNK